MTDAELNTLVDQLEDIFGLDDFQIAFPGNHRIQAKEAIRSALASACMRAVGDYEVDTAGRMVRTPESLARDSGC